MIRLPIPPSVNALYANRRRSPLQVIQGGRKPRGRIKTKAYEDWIVSAGWTLKMQRPKKFTCAVAISIYLPTKSGLDLGNCEKATTDLLVLHEVIPDDKQEYVREIHLRWCAGDQMLIDVQPCNALPYGAEVEAAGKVA